MIESEKIADLKQLQVPDHLLCPFSGDFMREPVTLDSGRTYERDNIVKYFEVQREVAKTAINNADSEEEEEQRDVRDYLICPVNLSRVDPELLVPNPSIKKATELFIEENPWAFEFDPRQKLTEIRLWDD